MKYKLIVLDLDGTLTNSKKEITPRNRETLIRMQEQGIRLVLASGRPTYGIVPLANELRMNEFGGFILSYNGGEIINWETQEMVYENVLPNEVVPVLYECARTHQLSILTYDGAEIITENSQDPYVLKEAFLNKMAVRETNDFLTDITLPVAKCLIVGDADKLIPLEAELCLRLQGRINVFRSEPYFLELVPQGIDKALSLAVLLKEIGVAREEVIAIGDGYNDLSMIRFAGLGIAMGNAQEPVKKAADYITLSNEEDGVAEAIKKFYPRIKIVMVTSMLEGRFLDRARRIGADSFWYKDSPSSDLIGVIEGTLQGKQFWPDSVPTVQLGNVLSCNLSDQEMETLRLLCEGKTNAEIAASLHVAESSVRTYINRMLEKTGYPNRNRLMVAAVSKRLVVPGNQFDTKK